MEFSAPPGNSASPPRTHRAPARRGRLFLPRLEGLEDRTVLSTLTVLNALDRGAGSLRDTITKCQGRRHDRLRSRPRGPDDHADQRPAGDQEEPGHRGAGRGPAGHQRQRYQPGLRHQRRAHRHHRRPDDHPRPGCGERRRGRHPERRQHPDPRQRRPVQQRGLGNRSARSQAAGGAISNRNGGDPHRHRQHLHRQPGHRRATAAAGRGRRHRQRHRLDRHRHRQHVHGQPGDRRQRRRHSPGRAHRRPRRGRRHRADVGGTLTVENSTFTGNQAIGGNGGSGGNGVPASIRSTWARAAPSRTSDARDPRRQRMYVHLQPGDRRLQRHRRHQRPRGGVGDGSRRGPEVTGGGHDHGQHVRPQRGPGRQRQQRRGSGVLDVGRGSRRRDLRMGCSARRPTLTASNLTFTNNQAVGGTGNTGGPFAGDGIGGGLANRRGHGHDQQQHDHGQPGHRRLGRRRRQRRGWAGWRPRECPRGRPSPSATARSPAIRPSAAPGGRRQRRQRLRRRPLQRRPIRRRHAQSWSPAARSPTTRPSAGRPASAASPGSARAAGSTSRMAASRASTCGPAPTSPPTTPPPSDDDIFGDLHHLPVRLRVRGEYPRAAGAAARRRITKATLESHLEFVSAVARKKEEGGALLENGHYGELISWRDFRIVSRPNLP